MNKPLITAVVILALPLAVFLGGGLLMEKMSGRQEASQKPLNKRWAYDKDDAGSFWGGFDDDGRRAELRFLELDLVYPLLYSAALATGLLLGWASIGRRFHPAWILAPVGIALLADWVENLVQISQLQRFMARTALQDGWIRLASAATALKLAFLIGLWLALGASLITLLFVRPPSTT